MRKIEAVVMACAVTAWGLGFVMGMNFQRGAPPKYQTRIAAERCDPGKFFGIDEHGKPSCLELYGPIKIEEIEDK